MLPGDAAARVEAGAHDLAAGLLNQRTASFSGSQPGRVAEDSRCATRPYSGVRSNPSGVQNFTSYRFQRDVQFIRSDLAHRSVSTRTLIHHAACHVYPTVAINRHDRVCLSTQRQPLCDGDTAPRVFSLGLIVA